MTRIPYKTLHAEFKRILLSLKFEEQKAQECAAIFADNSRDGVYSHGLNRFPRFVNTVKEGLVNPAAEPEMDSDTGIIERWNGNYGPGMLNARFCMDRAIQLAGKNGLGFVAVRNTNHWMRGGTYGWQAAGAGCIGICFTNSTTMMPPWGGTDPRLGNNPIVIAVPRKDGHVVLDTAMSQYSGGQLEKHRLDHKQLSYYGGYDAEGKLSKDPEAIFKSKRLLPIGFWKGSGLALMLDLLTTILSKGNSTEDISSRTLEGGVSQIFICIQPGNEKDCERIVNKIINYTKTSRTDDGIDQIYYPGEKTLEIRRENSEKGIPVEDTIWETVQKL
jgi:3-dehydro-L-gulonate 2-dehydrogenase